jgi:hypoxanthine phosphoribosyltransferase
MPKLIRVLSKEEIHEFVSHLAEKISSDYKDGKPVLVGVLKGSFIFLSDLARALTIPVEIDFIGASSYGAESFSSGKIKITKDLSLDVRDKDVLLVEDIADTGLTLRFIVDHLQSFNPKSVRICAMIDKRERRENDIFIDYAGHVTDEGFLVGYGLDYNEDYRNLPEIYHLTL